MIYLVIGHLASLNSEESREKSLELLLPWALSTLGSGALSTLGGSGALLTEFDELSDVLLEEVE